MICVVYHLLALLSLCTSFIYLCTQVIQKYKILPADFSERGGELTPTLKVKRSEVVKKYAQLIEGIYA